MTIKPILKYPGAKWSLAPWIVSHLPKKQHYLEPYCGSAAIYFNLPWRPRHAVLNDLSGDIVNLFRVIREQGEALAQAIALTPYARAEYDAICTTRGRIVRSGEPLEDARRWLIRCWMAQGGRVGNNAGWSHAGTSDTTPVARWQRLPAIIEDMAPLLKAEIENRPAVEVIARMNDDEVLIYADPPYVHSTRSDAKRGRKAYQYEMTDVEHSELLEALDKHTGPVVLSGYRCALYNERLAHWQSVETQAQAEKGQTRTEVLWLNSKAAIGQQANWLSEVAL